MTKRLRVSSTVVLLAAAAAAAGCGQEGPLVLPEDARPIERVEAPTNDSDDEEQDER
jgi:predicted small lipoprotein YifL